MTSVSPIQNYASLPSSEQLGRSYVAEAYVLLANHPHLRSHLKNLKIEEDGSGLTMSGILPSFYFKQLLQETLRPLNRRIVNNIKVS